MPFLQEMCQQGNLSPCDLPKFKSSTTFSQGISEGSFTIGIRAVIYPFLTKEKIRKETKIAGKFSLAQIPPYTPLS